MRNRLIFTLKAAISCALLYFAFAHVNLAPLAVRLNHLRFIWLAAGVLSIGIQIVLGALRWRQILQRCKTPSEPPLSVGKALRFNFVGAFFNQTLLSTVGGDAMRVWLLARDKYGWRSATYSAVLDRMIGVLVLAVLVVVCLPWSFALIGSIAGRTALLIVGFGSIAACSVFVALGLIRWSWLDRLWVTRQLVGASVAARRVLNPAAGGAETIGYSVLIHLASVTAGWGLAKAVAAPLEWGQALVLILPVLLIAAVPVSIGGWGTRETAMVLAFGYAGLPETDGLVVSVLLGLSLFVAGLPGVVFWLLGRGKDAEPASAETPPERRL